MPGGNRFSHGFFDDAGGYGYWWTATEYGDDNAYYRGMCYNNDDAYENNDGKDGGYSVRCVKDE